MLARCFWQIGLVSFECLRMYQKVPGIISHHNTLYERNWKWEFCRQNIQQRLLLDAFSTPWGDKVQSCDERNQKVKQKDTLIQADNLGSGYRTQHYMKCNRESFLRSFAQIQSKNDEKVSPSSQTERSSALLNRLQIHSMMS
jgi:hypothetical protein